jgi:membrane associated rhomboid family serine protease
LFKKQSSAVITIITVCSAFYLFELLQPSIINTLALGSFDYLKYSNEWYRLFTVALMHDTSSTLPFHMAFNMMALHQLGTPLEYVFGKAKFLTIFFVSLLAGSLTSAYFMAPNGASIGASGAVFGLFGAFIAAEKYLGVEAKSIYAIVAINFAIGFTIGGVDWRAHLGGLIGGYVITKLLLSLNASK